MQCLSLLVSVERFPRNSTTAVLSFLSKFIIVIVLDSIHIFHQEDFISKWYFGQFHMRDEKSIIFKRWILELISVPLKRRHITVLKTYMLFLFSPFCTPQGVYYSIGHINKENMGPRGAS